MPLGITPADIVDEQLRETMERASVALDDGQTRECVEACAEAYLALLRDRPRFAKPWTRCSRSRGSRRASSGG